MLMKQWDTKLQETLDLQALCMLIENECQSEIRSSCKVIADYFAENTKQEVPDPLYELVQLLFTKLQDEVEHLFRKETVLIFPVIKNVKSAYTILSKVTESIYQTQQGIINLLLKLRQLLNNYTVQPGWSREWRSCVNELFVLEREVHQWIYIEQSVLYPLLSSKTEQAE